MEEKANHYLDIINDIVPDDMNLKDWEWIKGKTNTKE